MEGKVTALGTSFNVATERARTAVTVTEHRVLVEASGEAVRVNAGEETAYGPDLSIQAPRPADMECATAPQAANAKGTRMSDPRHLSGMSASYLISMGFIATPQLLSLIENTRKVSEISVDKFDAIVLSGGEGPMFTFEKATELHRKFTEYYERGKLACALCHGVAIVKYAKLSTGEYLAKGKTVTGFTNEEENYLDDFVWSKNLLPRDKHIVPWRIEDEMKKLGANYIQAGLWRGFAVRDGNLVTRQQNFSGAETANVIVKALGQ